MLRKLQNLGTSKIPKHHKEEVAKLQLLNSAYMLVIVATFLDFSINMLVGYTPLTLLPLGIFVFMTILLYLNSIGKYNITKHIVIIFFGVYLVQQHYLFGMELHISPVFILLIIFIITMFDNQRKRMYWFCVYTLISYACSRYVTENFDHPYDYLVVPAIKDVYFLMSLGLSILLLVRILDQRRNYIDLTKSLLKDVEQKNSALEKQNSELERFAYATSHDLKTPLRNVTSFIELLDRKLKGKADPTITQYINYTKKGVSQMNSSIDDILTLSGLDFNKDQLEQLNLNSIIAELKFNYTQEIQDNSVELVVHDLPLIHGIKNQVNVLFQNLIDNGIKYNQSAIKRIEISGQEQLDSVDIFIKDNGIGIDEKYVTQIFLPFKRLHSNNVFTGTGLGLTIVQKIIEKHRGKIHFESTEEGTTFRISFPKLINFED